MRTLLREINATAAVREAIAAFAEANIPKLQQWLDKIAEKHPDKAAGLYMRALEYFTPKLAGTETTSPIARAAVIAPVTQRALDRSTAGALSPTAGPELWMRSTEPKLCCDNCVFESHERRSPD